jgi:hypothetical protein
VNSSLSQSILLLLNILPAHKCTLSIHQTLFAVQDEDDVGNWHTLKEIMKGEDMAVADEEAMLDEQGGRTDAEEPTAADDAGNNVCRDGEVSEAGGRSAASSECNGPLSAS